MFERNNNPYGSQPNRYLNDNARMRALELLAKASIAFALLGLVTSMMGVGFIFGAVAIALGLLSRSRESQGAMRAAKRGILFGSIAVVLSIVMLARSFFTIIEEYGSLSGYYDAYIEYYEDYYDTTE